MSYKSSRRVFATILLVPSVLVIVGVIVYPLGSSIVTSFHKESLAGGTSTFIGLDNYLRLFTGPFAPLFWEAAGNTLIYALGSTLIATVIGFGLALLLTRPVRGRAFLRSMFLLPWIVPWVSASLLFMWMMDPTWGVLNDILHRVGLIDRFVPWFGSTDTAMPAFIVLNVWKLIPFMMVMIMAGLQSLPVELTDAARIDGASYPKVLRYITVPHLRPVLGAVTLISIIWGFQAFTPFWIVTQGGPQNATTTLSVYLYKQAFYSFDFGMATAIGSVWLLFLVVLSALWIRTLARGDV